MAVGYLTKLVLTSTVVVIRLQGLNRRLVEAHIVLLVARKLLGWSFVGQSSCIRDTHAELFVVGAQVDCASRCWCAPLVDRFPAFLGGLGRSLRLLANFKILNFE